MSSRTPGSSPAAASRFRLRRSDAAHASIALALGRKVDYIERDPGHVFPGEQAGFASIPIGEAVEPSRICVCLAGYWATGRLDWPPAYEQAKVMDLEGLRAVIQLLALSREEYEELVVQTHCLLEDPDVQRLTAALARALDRVPRIYEPEIRQIAEAVGFPVPERDEEAELCPI